ncbi:hypothetical protein SAMN02745704_02587 [Paucidesulfovibrio gracilis DSM 16080]|uniref:Carboxypeptidase regulatory-like domain-containing protein n=1 Tax=Paucidesulfovibrio gracilis DSM 16080 TaxID=1121449 RepID=A0A1T4XY60_9BACT|nr:carboxypeptidase-like regulatory domain-containing protein [Paucidesulfovibrio gracilis]SKA94454.1 hypothetical protein SAMN02745704_02587 [Paucidesulfovibrio gracilis DSM 16080]
MPRCRCCRPVFAGNRLVSFWMHAVVLAMVLFATWGGGPALAALPLAEQEKLLWRAVEDVLAEHPEWAAQTRLLGVGSWMGGSPGPNADIDITVGHADRATEKKLAQSIQARVDELAAGAGHEVKVTFSRDVLFEDRFRGEVGQKFFYDYADKTGDYRSCFVMEAGPEGIRPRRARTERFWIDTGQKIPRQVEGAYRFVEDSVVFLERYSTKPTLVQAEKAAKYLDNYESFLKEHLRRNIGTLNGLDELPEAMRTRMRALLRYKAEVGRDAGRAAERLRDALGVESKIALEAELRSFVRDTRRYLINARDDVELVERLHRAGLLDRAGGPARAVKMRDSLLTRVFRRAKVPLAALDAYMIMKAYYEGGIQAAALETGLALAGYAVPPALVAGIVAELAREVFVAGVEWAGNELVFDTINDSFLAGHIYAMASPVQIFTWDQSPFRGLTRQTLACRFTSMEMIRAGVNQYLELAKSWRAGLFASEGSGDITPRLFARMEADRQRSAEWLDQQRDFGLLLARGVYANVPRPLRAVINGQPASLEAVAPASTNQPAEFRLELEALFGLGRVVPSNYGFYERIICERGVEQAGVWLQEHMVEQFRPGYSVRVAVETNHTEGWVLEGNWPKHGSKFWFASENASYARALRTLRIRPTPGARSDCTVRITFSTAFNEGETPRQEQITVRLRASLAHATLAVDVVDAASGAPVSSATIQADGPAGLSTTGARARFEDVPGGMYTVRGSAPGYAGDVTRVRALPGGQATARLQLIPLEQPAPEPDSPAPPRPDTQKPRPPKPEPKPEPKPDPALEHQALCDCINTYKTTVETQKLLEGCRKVNGANFCGGEMRLVQPYTWDEQQEACVGRAEWWDCDKSRRAGEEWFNTSTVHGPVNRSSAAWFCRQLGIKPGQ